MNVYEELVLKKEILQKKQMFYSYIRDFFLSRGFYEAETPVLAEWYGQDINIEPFVTYYKDGRTLYLQISPEFFLKKLIVAGYDKVFELSRVFRNGEYSSIHSPEFTMLEWYEEGANYIDIMNRVVELLLYILESMNLSLGIDITEQDMIRVRDVFYDYTGIDIDEFKDDKEAFLEKAISRGYNIKREYSWDEIFFSLFVSDVEPNLPKDRLLFLYDYPYPLGGMARFKDDFYTERFEMYINGVEIANGYSELVDPEEQLKRWEKVGNAIDMDFIEGLKLYDGEIGGIAVGVDRLFMLLMKKERISDVLLFPFKYVRRRSE